MILGISGKAQSGKDTVGRIIQELTTGKKLTDEEVAKKLQNPYATVQTPWEIKKFAYPLKVIVAMLLGCTLADLERERYKNAELPSRWDRWLGELRTPGNAEVYSTGYFATKELAREELQAMHKRVTSARWEECDYVLIRSPLTPRKMLVDVSVLTWRWTMTFTRINWKTLSIISLHYTIK